MQYNNRAILAMIASALNPPLYEVRDVSHTVLAELETLPDHYGLTIYMADGAQFRITADVI